MKRATTIVGLVILLISLGMGLGLRTDEVRAQEKITSNDIGTTSHEPIILRDPFVDPQWLKDRREEEERRRAEEKRRSERKEGRQALALKGIVKVGESFVAIVDGKTLKAGDDLQGSKILEVNSSGIKILSEGGVREIPWKPGED